MLRRRRQFYSKLLFFGALASKAVIQRSKVIVSDTRTKKVRIESEINTCTSQLLELTNEEQITSIKKWCSEAAEKASLETRTRQKQKFDRLKEKRENGSLDPKRVVKNISSRSLSTDEEKVLALGLNFAVAPKHIPYRDIIAATETTARQLASDHAQLLREGVSQALSRARPPKSNLDKGMHRAIKDLRGDDNIVILPADKGNATVVMDRTEYTMKMNRMLEDVTYTRLKRDPTSRIETKVGKMLKSLEGRGHMSDKERRYLTPQCSSPPQMYGLPKIHKPDIPLRPIVSAIGSPTYLLAKMLAGILAPLAGKTDTFVKNSSHFADMVKNIDLHQEDTLISFDVTSLFTKVPIEEALQVISTRLTQDDTLEDRTAIPIADICALTELCLRSTYFSFDATFFEQVEGAAMGSPLSPIVANLYMEAFEERALKSAVQRPRVWLRYVDDTFVIWPHGEDELDTFHNHLNNQHPSIQFTMEKESNGRIPFLDVLVERKEVRLSTKVYRKSTHTDRYIHFDSYHHPQVKSGVISCLRNRAEKICDQEHLGTEMAHLRKTFKVNGYPYGLISKTLKKQNHHQHPLQDDTTDQEKPKLLYLPYIRQTSEHIQRVCKRIGVKTVFRSSGTLRGSLMKVKEPRPPLLKKGVVYKVPCMDCSKAYIGETGGV